MIARNSMPTRPSRISLFVYILCVYFVCIVLCQSFQVHQRFSKVIVEFPSDPLLHTMQLT